MDGWWVEPLLELLDAGLAPLEAWHGGAVAAVHQVHENEDAVLMLPECVEPLVEQLAELIEVFGIEPSHNLDVLCRKFKRHVPFNFDPFAWGVADEEAVVDMPERSVPTDHDIAVVAILNLQQVDDEAVCSQAPNKLPEPIPIVDDLYQGRIPAFELINCDAVVHELYDAGVVGHRYYFVGVQLQRYLLGLEDVLEHLEQLHGELFLLQVVVGFYYQGDQLVLRQSRIGRVFGDSLGTTSGRLHKDLWQLLLLLHLLTQLLAGFLLG